MKKHPKFQSNTLEMCFKGNFSLITDTRIINLKFNTNHNI